MVNSNYKIWTEDEITILKEQYSNIPLSKICKILTNKSKDSIYRKAKKLNLKSGGSFGKKKYTYNENFFKEPNITNCFYAGLLASDGCIHRNNSCWAMSLCLSSSDEFILYKFREDCESTHPIKKSLKISNKSPNGSWMSRFSIYSCIPWVNDLKRVFGVIPQKAHRVAPPNFTNKNLELAYILGYLMGDGCISLKDVPGHIRPIIFVSSCSPKIISYIEEIFCKYFPNIYTNQRQCARFTKKYGAVYRYQIGGIRASVILDYLIQLGCPAFDRKLNNPKFNECLGWYRKTYPHYFENNSPYSENISHSSIPSVLEEDGTQARNK